MENKYKSRISDDKTKMIITAEWSMPVENLTGKELTEGQIKALKAYCDKFIPVELNYSNITSRLTITACSVSRSAASKDTYYYDADTGELYTQANIFDGSHEVRIRSIDD